jgi:DnaJ-class molecular chaperone
LGWKGFAIGMVVGGARGSWIGAIVVALLGDYLENRFFLKRRRSVSSRIFSEDILHDDELSAAYKTLGVRPDAPYEVVHAAYREFAKKYHPDAMKAGGSGDKEIAQASEKMAKINEAWNLIKESRKANE